MTGESAARDVAGRWQAAWGSADLARIGELLADDCIVWRNYEQVEHPKNAYLSMLAGDHKAVSGLRHGQLQLLVHADGFVEQAMLEGQAAAGPLSAPVCRITRLKDGKISRIDEYYDSPTLEGALK
jgi:ketosteroid isomerase-like protein